MATCFTTIRDVVKITSWRPPWADSSHSSRPVGTGGGGRQWGNRPPKILEDTLTHGTLTSLLDIVFKIRLIPLWRTDIMPQITWHTYQARPLHSTCYVYVMIVKPINSAPILKCNQSNTCTQTLNIASLRRRSADGPPTFRQHPADILPTVHWRSTDGPPTFRRRSAAVLPTCHIGDPDY